MTRFLLDTTALIDFSKGREPARTRLLEMIDAGDELGVCPVNVAEFYAGVPPAQRDLWDEFFSSLGYWEIDLGTAREAGCFRYDFARKGVALSTADTLVASVALGKGAVIVSNNVKDYPLPGIALLPFTG